MKPFNLVLAAFAAFVISTTAHADDDALSKIDETFVIDAEVLDTLSEKDRTDVEDLIGDINKKRERARGRLIRAEKARARGDAEGTAQQEESARRAANDAENDAARIQKILTGSNDPGPNRIKTVSTTGAAPPTKSTNTTTKWRRPDMFDIESAKIVLKLPDSVRTIWFTDFGRVAAFEEKADRATGPYHQIALWKDKRLHMRDILTDNQTRTRLNLKALEPTSFAWTPAKDLLQLGAYKLLGDDEVAGRTCEKWHYLLKAGGAGGSHGCRWNAIEMYWIDLDADGNEVRRREVIELEEGVTIPQRFLDLEQ